MKPLDLVIVTAAPEVAGVSSLKKAAEEKGWNCEAWDPFEIEANGGTGKNFLSYQSVERSLPARAIFRPGLKSREIMLDLSAWFESRGVTLQNSTDALRVATDQWLTLVVLEHAGLPVPPSAVVQRADYLKEPTVCADNFPVVVKIPCGSQGIGILLAESRESLTALLDYLWLREERVIVQAFYSEAAGSDLRILVRGERVLAAMERKAAPGDFRSNLHRGGTAKAVEPSLDQKELAVSALKAVGLKFGGVDLIFDGESWRILEVNPSPGLEGIERVSGSSLGPEILKVFDENLG